jgi:hypothetical protein
MSTNVNYVNILIFPDDSLTFFPVYGDTCQQLMSTVNINVNINVMYVIFCVQARSFCRGLVARSVSPSIRSALLTRWNHADTDTTTLRSFLDLGSSQRGWRKTQKGSAEVSWKCHQHNSHSECMEDMPTLNVRVNAHFANHPGREWKKITYTSKVDIITTFVSINGADWYVDGSCEYIG